MKTGIDRSDLRSYQREYMRMRRQDPAYREKGREQHRRYRRERPFADKAKQIKYLYGLSLDEYRKAVSCPCEICGTYSPDVEGKSMHLDHDHETGKVRGTLCAKCNKGLGHFRDNPELVRRAASYLNSHKSDLA